MSSRPWPPARAISSPRRASSLAADLAQVRARRARRAATPVGRSRSRRRIPSTAACHELDTRRRGDRAATGVAALDELDRLAQRLDAGHLHPVDEPRLVDGRRRRPRPAGSRAGRAPRPSAGRPAPTGPRRRATARRSARSGPVPARTCSDPSRIPTAIARSSEAPALRRSAGARLTVIRRGGWTNPALRSAPRTRSRASWSAASASPTTVNPGRPGATSTSTRMNRPSRPWSVADGTIASTPRTLRAGAHPPVTARLTRRLTQGDIRRRRPNARDGRLRARPACRPPGRNGAATRRAPSRPS